jgi:hypothetical protein
MALLGLLLLLAATLKAVEMASDPDADSRAWTFLLVACEWGLGVWLLSGHWPRQAWRAAIAALLVFTVSAGLSWIRGEASCGCFGRFAVPPSFTFVGDLALLAAVLVSKPPRIEEAGWSRPQLGVIVATLLPLGGAAWFALHPHVAELRPDGKITGDARAVATAPNAWLGKPLPLLKHIDIGEALSEDVWRVLFYRPECQSCQATLRRLIARRSGDVRAGADGGPPLAIVLLGGGEDTPEEIPEGVQVGRLDPTRSWQVPPSTVVELRDGFVTGIGVSKQMASSFANSEEERTNSSAAAPKVRVQEPMPDAVGHQQPGVPDLFLADLGYVEQADHREIRYEVRSPGGKPLQIRGTEIECSCTALTDQPQMIAASGTTPVHVTFAAPQEAMRYSKNLILLTNDPRHPRLTLRLKARVGLPLAVEQMTEEMVNATLRVVRFVIRNDSERPVRLVYATVNHSAFAVQLPEAAIEGKTTATVLVKQKVNGDRPSATTDPVRVTIATDHPAQSSLALDVERRRSD